MTIAAKLNLLVNTKESIRQKLGLPTSIPFSEYYKHMVFYAYSPVIIFSTGQQGAIYDPSDLTTLWQNTAGTVPVTKSGDPVALMRDKSGNNNHATQTISASRPTYQTDGVNHWLKGDGVDDFLKLPPMNFEVGSIALTVKDNTVGSDVKELLSSGVSGYISSTSANRTLAINDASAQRVVDTPSQISLVNKKSFILNKEGGTLRVKTLSQSQLITSYNLVQSLNSAKGLSAVQCLFSYSESSSNKVNMNFYGMVATVGRLTDAQMLDVLTYMER